MKKRRARAPNLEAAVASAKTRSDALAIAKAEAKQRDEEATRTRAELEAANLAAKFGAASSTKAKAIISQEEETPCQQAKLHDCAIFEMENEALKKLLADAYVEIATLKDFPGD